MRARSSEETLRELQLRGARRLKSVNFRANRSIIWSLTQDATCNIYMEGVAEPKFTQTKTFTAAPGTVSTYLFLFTPTAPGTYYYTIDTTGYNLPPEASPLLEVR